MERTGFRAVPTSRQVLWGTLLAVAFATSGCNGSSSAPNVTLPPGGLVTPTPHPGTSSSPGASASPSPSPGSSSSPAPTVSPSPIDANHVAMVVKLAPEAISSAPNASPGSTYIYITGQQTSTGAGATCSTTTFLQVTDAQGDIAPFPTGGAAVTAIPFYGNGVTSGNTSQVIQLPALCSARIYVSVNGPLSITSTGGPAPWSVNGASGFPQKFDIVEYTMPANGLAAPSTDVDTSQENMIGLDLGLTLTGSQHGTQTTGLKDGFMTQVNSAAATIGSPWSGVISAQWPTRLLSPLSVQYVFNSTGNSAVPGFNPGTFLDSAIQTAWNHYQSPTCMNVTVSTATGDYLAGKSVYGQVDASGNFDFYDPAFVTGCAANLNGTQSAHIVAQIPSPFNQTFWISAVGMGWSSATGSELMENGPYLLPATAPSSGGSIAFTNPYTKGSADIGNTVATALNRGVFDPAVSTAYETQPYCPAIANLYPASAAATQNMWATAVWSVAKNTTYGSGKAYAIPYDDKCGFSTDIVDSGATVMTITVNAN